MITGEVVYKSIRYHFTYENHELRMDAIEEGGFSFFSCSFDNGSLHLEEDYITGECFPSGNPVIFIPKYDSFSASNNTMIVKIQFLVSFTSEIRTITSVCIEAAELDYIYNVNRSISFDFKDSTKIENIRIRSSAETTTECGEIKIDDIVVQCSFQISQLLRFGVVKEPIQLSSFIELKFPPTNDYRFIIKLYYYIRGLLRFLCYRKNVCITKTSLYTTDNNKDYQCGDFITCFEPEVHETQEVLKDRYIPLDYIYPHVCEILQDIIDGQLYLNHLPISSKHGKSITNASFLMITAAFEAEFSRFNPEGLPLSPSRIKAQAAAETAMRELIGKAQGTEKKIYKFLEKMIKIDATKEKVVLAAKVYSPLVDIFGKQLYALNHVEYNYATIGQRVFDQRNIFAHGKRSDFIRGALLDVMYLEFLIYGMQLSKYGICPTNIQKAINKLFGRNIAIK